MLYIIIVMATGACCGFVSSVPDDASENMKTSPASIVFGENTVPNFAQVRLGEPLRPSEDSNSV